MFRNFEVALGCGRFIRRLDARIHLGAANQAALADQEGVHGGDDIPRERGAHSHPSHNHPADGLT